MRPTLPAALDQTSRLVSNYSRELAVQFGELPPHARKRIDRLMKHAHVVADLLSELAVDVREVLEEARR